MILRRSLQKTSFYDSIQAFFLAHMLILEAGPSAEESLEELAASSLSTT